METEFQICTMKKFEHLFHNYVNRLNATELYI